MSKITFTKHGGDWALKVPVSTFDGMPRDEYDGILGFDSIVVTVTKANGATSQATLESVLVGADELGTDYCICSFKNDKRPARTTRAPARRAPRPAQNTLNGICMDCGESVSLCAC